MLRIANIVLALAVVMAVFTSAAYADAEARAEAEALSRDGLGRANPDELASGFFATWPVILVVLSVAFLAASVLSLIGYTTGVCRSPYNAYAAPAGQV